MAQMFCFTKHVDGTPQKWMISGYVIQIFSEGLNAGMTAAEDWLRAKSF
jgi:hypothetical protein